MEDRARATALFLNSLVRGAADPALRHGPAAPSCASSSTKTTSARTAGASRSPRRRSAAGLGRGVRGASRRSSQRWPTSRRAPARAVLDAAEALKREAPRRTAAQVARALAEAGVGTVSPRTLQRHFSELGLNASSPGPKRTLGRFEATDFGELWTGDGLHGPTVSGRRAVLCAFIDDWSRRDPGWRFGHGEDTVRLEAALRQGMAARGVPARIYLDNGSAMVSTQLLRACASLGVILVHSRPGRPAGRGKIERAFRTVREQFVVELAHTKVESLERLNSLFFGLRRVRLPQGGALRDRRGADRPVLVPWGAAPRHPRAAAGRPAVRAPAGDEDGDGQPLRQPLRGRRGARRRACRTRVRSLIRSSA